MYAAAKELIESQVSDHMEMDVAFGCEIPVRSVFIDGKVMADDGERRQFSIVYEYEYVTVSGVLVVANNKIPVNEFIRYVSFDSIEHAKKFIKVAIGWIKSHDTCEAFVDRYYTGINWKTPTDSRKSIENLCQATTLLRKHGQKINYVIVGGKKLLIYGDHVNINYESGIVTGMYSIAELRRPAAFESIDYAVRFIEVLIRWSKERKNCADYISKELPDIMLDGDTVTFE